MEIVRNRDLIEVYAEGDIFIIPNRAAKISSYLDTFQDKMRNDIIKFLADNDQEFDEETFYNVECWFLSEELISDNIPDHGFSFIMNGARYRVFPGEISRSIPLQLLPSKEGESAIISFKNLICYKIEFTPDAKLKLSDKEYKVDLNISLTAKQKEYRYKNFGSFEDVLEKVCY